MKGLLQALLAVVLLVGIGAFVVQRVGEDALRGESSITMPTLTAALPTQSIAAPAAPVTTVAQAAPSNAAPSSAQAQDATALIQQVIQRSNEQQVQAIAARDPALMSDTVTDEHFQQLVEVNQSLLDHGVSSISLVGIEWGPVSVSGSTATATTFETWRTRFDTGRVEQSRDQNDYTLVLDAGTWKIRANDHPETPPAVSPTPQQRPVPAVPGAADDNTSRNWSGYAATVGHFTAVSGTWTVPEFTPDGAFGIDATWVGIGGVHTRDLIQAGTEQTVTGSGRSQYGAWVETLPQASRPIPLSVHPGDSVSVSITEQSLNNWLIQFVNHTTGETYQETQRYTSSHSSAEWVEEAPSAARGGILPLSNFGLVEFSAGTAVKDGQTVTIADAGADPITMLTRNGQPLAVPSPLGEDGASFSVARTDAPANQAGPRRRGR
jgi:hypothetical protein